ncbi:MAG: penicillin-binding protein 2, partial [Gammaproteobacteria bacterium]
KAGFGTGTGVGYPGESDGILTDFDRWSDVHRATLAYGYGLSVTPLQLARAYAAIANGGLLPPVTLSADAPVEHTKTRVMSKETARRVRSMLETVVGAGGTGQRAAVPGYRVAGKTGTVRKPAPGGYAEDRYMAVFAGFAPASSPRLVVVVTVDEPAGTEYYGGQVAAPVFAEVVGGALRLLGISPDDRSIRLRRVTLAAGEEWHARSPVRAVQ